MKGRGLGERREIGEEIKSRSHRGMTEVAQRPAPGGKAECRLVVGQSGRPLPPPAVHKANAATTGAKMQRSKGVTQGRGVKMKAAQPAAKNLPDKGAVQKPLAGRVFYLDITSRLVAEKLEKDIKELGGTIEGFLSKEISCLITNKKEAKCTKSLKYPFSMPSPEPASGSSSTRPNAHRGDGKNGGTGKKPEKEDVSRGKSLLKKVIKEQEILPKNSILANALNWGVRILHLDEAKIYLDKKKRSLQPMKQPEQPEAPAKPVAKRATRRKVKAQKLKSPFIKVEDSSGLYRPIYLVLPLFRSFQSTVSKPCRPVEKKPPAATVVAVAAAPPKAPEVKQSLNKTWHGQDEGNVSHNKLKEQKKRGYCECCLLKYDDLEAHLLSLQHKHYAQGPYYQDLDNLITSFEFDFVDWSKIKQEAQSSGLFIPGKLEESELTQQNNQYSPKLSPVKTPEPGIVSTKPQDVACALVNNLVCHSEPFFTIPYPPQSICSITCVTDSFSKAPSSQVITPTHENVSPTQQPEPLTISPSHTVSTQKGSKTCLDVELSIAALNTQNCLSEAENGCPSKRLKLEDSMVEVSAAPPVAKTQTCHDLGNGCSLGQSDVSCHLPHSSPRSKVHRKVRPLERKVRKQEEPPSKPPYKVSVPLEDYKISASKDLLECLFESSDHKSEFCGFSCNSMDIPQNIDKKERPSSDQHLLWAMFSSGGSSASTFNGF